MINFFVLSTEITIYEALELKEQLALETANKSEAYTKEYKSLGITKLGIWIDHDKLLYEPAIRNCTMNVTVNARQFCMNGKLDADKVLDVLNKILVSVKSDGVVWKLQNISFIYTVYSPYAMEYVGLLNSGYSLSNRGMKKETDNKKSPKKLTFSNKGISISYAYNEAHNCLDISLWLLKQKVSTIAKGYGINQREFKAYADILQEVEWYLWSDYLEKIAGREDYYSYKRAEEIIEACERSKVEKNNMESVLKGVAVYKGIEHYLSHVTDAKATYKFMEGIHTRDSAKKYMEMLRQKGINPVSISRRDSKEKDIHFIPNLINVLECEDVTRYRRIKHKTNNQDTLPVMLVGDINNSEENLIDNIGLPFD